VLLFVFPYAVPGRFEVAKEAFTERTKDGGGSTVAVRPTMHGKGSPPLPPFADRYKEAQVGGADSSATAFLHHFVP